MKILGLEFSSTQRSVALVQDLTECKAQQTTRKPQTSINEVVETGAKGGHTIGMIEAVLLEASIEREEIQTVAVGLGPGSYSGIRRAIAAAQGWQVAREQIPINLIGISSVEALVAQARTEAISGLFNIVIDAQRGEFYLAVYENRADGCRNVEPLRLATLDELRQRETRGELFFGPEAARFQNGRIAFPRASAVAQLAIGRTDFVKGEMLEPVYLRTTQFVKTQPAQKTA